jgi:DNA-binding CsgD family transcriptional regulator
VDKSGQVIWASPETLESIQKHPILTVSAGRVRARKQNWDRVLQRAITQAARYHGFYQLRHFEGETGGPFHYPAVLGETDDGGIAVIHVLVRDGVTYLQFDGTRFIDRRLSIAQAVFGLSDGQRRVAHHVADGLGPKGAADALEISINTARTHLTRLYEKTGVNSQAALVRILLSVG